MRSFARVNARPDDRAEAFDIPHGETVECFECKRRGYTRVCPRGVGFTVGAVDSPYQDGQIHFFCIDHLPDNVVLVDPDNSFECRDKDGKKRWRES